MPRSSRAYLEDILDACAAVGHIVDAHTIEEYVADRVLRSAVEREFMIVGEAVNKLGGFRSDLLTDLSGSRLIVDFRNRLAHEYHNIDDQMVWAIAEHDAPVLLGEVQNLLAESQNDPEI